MWESAQKADRAEENTSAVPAGNRTPDLSIMSQALYHRAGCSVSVVSQTARSGWVRTLVRERERERERRGGGRFGQQHNFCFVLFGLVKHV